MGLLRKGAETGFKSVGTGWQLGRFLTQKKGLGFLVIILGFTKGVIKSIGEAWAQKSPIPVIEKAGTEIMSADSIINFRSTQLGTLDLNSIPLKEKALIYSDLYSALFTFFVLFIFFYMVARGFFTGGAAPWLNSFLLATTLMFLVSMANYFVQINILGTMQMDSFVWPGTGIYNFFKYGDATLPLV